MLKRSQVKRTLEKQSQYKIGQIRLEYPMNIVFSVFGADEWPSHENFPEANYQCRKIDENLGCPKIMTSQLDDKQGLAIPSVFPI